MAKKDSRMTIPGESRTDRPQATPRTKATGQRAALLLASILVLLVLPSAASAAVSFDRTDFQAGANPFSVAVGDFNGDGDPDLVTANVNSNDVSVRLGRLRGPDRTGDLTRVAPHASRRHQRCAVRASTIARWSHVRVCLFSDLRRFLVATAPGGA